VGKGKWEADLQGALCTAVCGGQASPVSTVRPLLRRRIRDAGSETAAPPASSMGMLPDNDDDDDDC